VLAGDAKVHAEQMNLIFFRTILYIQTVQDVKSTFIFAVLTSEAGCVQGVSKSFLPQ